MIFVKGWYRDCGAYPHTNDIDISIWAHDYEKKIKKHFLANKNVRIWAQLGLLKDSLEFRLIGNFSVDLVELFKSTNLLVFGLADDV